MDSTMRLRPLSVGDLFDAAFRLYRSHFFSFLGVVLLPQLLLVIARVGMWRWRSARVLMGVRPASLDGRLNIASVVLYVILLSVIAGALANMIMRDRLGERTSILQAYRFSVRRYGSLVLASVLYWSINSIPLVVVLQLCSRLLDWLIGGTDFFGIIQLLIFLVIVVPLLLLLSPIVFFCFARFLLIAQVIVLEGCGPFVGLLRSWRLTIGSIRRTIGVILSTSFFALLFGAIIPLVLYSTIASARVSDLADQWLGVQIVFLVIALGLAVVLPVVLAAHALLYDDLRAQEAKVERVPQQATA